MQIQGHHTGLTEFSHISISTLSDSPFYHISYSFKINNNLLPPKVDMERFDIVIF